MALAFSFFSHPFVFFPTFLPKSGSANIIQNYYYMDAFQVKHEAHNASFILVVQQIIKKG